MAARTRNRARRDLNSRPPRRDLSSKPPGATSLAHLLAGMDARLDPGEYVFAELAAGVEVPAGAFAIVREDEGASAILPAAVAARLGLRSYYPCRRITLHVASSLEAVGFAARVCAALAASGIAANLISALHHDHLFVPRDRAAEALEVLDAMRNGS